MTDRWVVPWLALLVDGSIRWGIVLAVLAVWFALRPPRRAATRHLLCVSALAAGAVLPFAPRWGDAVVPWPSRASKPAIEPLALSPSPASFSRPSPAVFVASDRPSLRPDAEVIATARPVAYVPPSRSAAVPLDRWRLAALATVGTWAIVVGVLLARLACGGVVLARMRRGLAEVGEDANRLVDECRARLGTSRPVRLAMHPGVASPVVLGGLRPLVLVPTDWEDWPEPQRRACLLHELAHLTRYDDWSKFAQELIRVPFFFHPLALWLFARLDRERELLCDEAVVALGTEPESLARLLLELAKRPVRLVPVSRPVLLPFLDRRTVVVRIERLLEDDMPRTLSRSSLARSLLLGSLALAACLAVGGLRVRGASPRPIADDPKPTPPVAKPSPPVGVKEAPRELRGIVVDGDDHPVADATVVAGSYDPGRSGHQVLKTDAQGRFTLPFPQDAEVVYLVARKEGLRSRVLSFHSSQLSSPLDLKLHLASPGVFNAALFDADGKPISGAKVRIKMLAYSSQSKRGQETMVSTSYEEAPRTVVERSPVEDFFLTTTADDGSFSFRSIREGAGLKLEATAPDGRILKIGAQSNGALDGGSTPNSMEGQGFIAAVLNKTFRLTATPSAKISGRVVSAVPGVDVSGLKASYQSSRKRSDTYVPERNFGDKVPVDRDGRFVFDGLEEGTINIFAIGKGENEAWTYRAAKDVELVPGKTSEVVIELIRGVEVEGTVIAQGTGAPVEKAMIGSYGPYRPRTGAATRSDTTDARGRYQFRLPSGETYFYVMGPPSGFTRLPNEGSSRTVTIPEGVAKFEVPPIEVTAAVTVRGQVVDAANAPVVGANVVGMCEGGLCRPFGGPETLTDAKGEFRLPEGLNNVVAIGKPARLLIRFKDGTEFEAAALPAKDGSVVVQVPVAEKSPAGVEGPRDVAPDELAGIVVDTDGKPIEGAEADVWTWFPGNEAKTDAKGVFRLRKLDKGEKVEVVVRKAGYTPKLFLTQPVGQAGWVVVLGNKTYFEGRVTGPDGKPVAGALLRANNGPKQAEGVRITEIWTEAKSGDDGRYRLYAQPDVYDIQVRIPGVGVARLPETPLGPDEARPLDIHLEPGVTFRAKLVDSLTGAPVPGVRLWDWQQPGVEGRSDKDGVVTIADMLPGRFNFQLDAPGFTRWWSEEAVSEWNRRHIDESRGGWQRNFDHLDFDLKTGIAPVAITLERGATVTGKVVDPDGKPVAGATVAPALTGTGNSLTGDTRFSVTTDKNGGFRVVLPASGDRDYNLIAHDGKYQEWRNWANGVLPPFRTKPGDAIDDVEIRLTRPATVRGRVTDAQGRPIEGRDVRASAADRLENRYYDPTVKTASDGTYELKFIRPGEQFIQVSPFWLDARQAPEGTSRAETLAAGASKDGVDFKVP
ncbi:MAG: carboxypeptidase regulatory-like domain-containing protein [Paludisphaera borealis]|uniref:carboxypeptidase regulatory-like domain-containing protein n=1 Tax=Paludisphaera borealis TaxID=1387353 RepID=UPI0028484AD3|nr:carboxypeptidase regulatory-like domain-containing protein [Paludisphaera borealis]MDR3619077.1 carboxypeptidase regulatory-like domain-containing protein [Paludisphaera borealis]